jgi:hypothetical protein
MEMMVSLQRRLDNRSDGQQFFSHALRYISTSSGRRVKMEKWMITSYEVEFGPQIGSGGLYVIYLSIRRLTSDFVDHSGQVFMGTWNKAQVALKVLTTENGITPNSTVCLQLVFAGKPSGC